MKFLEKHKLSVTLITTALFIVWLCLLSIFSNHLALNYAYTELSGKQGFMIFMQIIILILIHPIWMSFVISMIKDNNKEKYYYMKVTTSEYQIIQNYRSSKELERKESD